MARARLLGLLGLLAACDGVLGPGPAETQPPTPARDRVTPGNATPVTLGDPYHGAPPPLRVDDPGRAAHVGRAPRRIDIDQFRASLEQVVGARWVGPRTVITPEAPTGSRFEQDADLIEFFAATLGRPDYIVTTAEVLVPTVTFSKLAGDAAREVCARSVTLDPGRPPAERRILVDATATDALPAREPAVRRNVATLAMRFWGFELAPESATVDGLVGLFRVATAQPGATPLDGWRAVCIALATDVRFLSY